MFRNDILQKGFFSTIIIVLELAKNIPSIQFYHAKLEKLNLNLYLIECFFILLFWCINIINFLIVVYQNICDILICANLFPI